MVAKSIGSKPTCPLLSLLLCFFSPGFSQSLIACCALRIRGSGLGRDFNFSHLNTNHPVRCQLDFSYLQRAVRRDWVLKMARPSSSKLRLSIKLKEPGATEEPQKPMKGMPYASILKGYYGYAPLPSLVFSGLVPTRVCHVQ